MIFSKFKKFFTDNKKIFYYLGFFVVVYLMSSDVSFAIEEVPTDWGKKGVEILDGFLMGASTIVGAFTYFVTLFLEPGWINGTFFGLNEKFKMIWILISNIVYFIFAFILIWIAFMNIIGKGEKWELKQALPKFIIGVLIVPFSWFFVQFVLSISSILTMSALSLPYDTFDDYKKRLDSVNIPNECFINMSGTGKTEEGDPEGYFYCKKDSTIKLGESLKTSPFGLLSIYSYGVLNLDQIDEIRKNEVSAETIKNIGDVIVKILFNFLFIIVYLILFITLGIVLAVRGMYLWIYTMLSPIFGLMYFFDKKDGGGEGVLAKFNIKEFISLSLVPVYVMLALSFGLLFISIVITGMSNGNSNNDKITITSNDKQGQDTIKILGGGNDGNASFNLTVKGPVGGIEKAKSTTSALASGANGVLGVIGTMILNLMGVVVLRISIMAALRSSDITKAVTQPIYDFGNQVGSLMAKSPQYAPLFGGQSMQSMQRIGGSISNHYEGKASTKAADFLKNTPFGDSAKSASEYKKLRSDILVGNKKLPQDLVSGIRKTIKLAEGDVKKLYNNTESRETLFVQGTAALGADEMKKIGIESASNLDNLPKVIDLLKAIDNKPNYWGLYEGNLKVLNDETDLIKLVNDLHNSAEITTSTNNLNVRIDSTGGSHSLKGVGVSDINLTQDGKTGLFNVIFANDIQQIANGINEGSIDSRILDKFDSGLKGKLKEYFNDKGEFIKAGGGNGDNFPWEIKN